MGSIKHVEEVSKRSRDVFRALWALFKASSFLFKLKTIRTLSNLCDISVDSCFIKLCWSHKNEQDSDVSEFIPPGFQLEGS